MSGPTRVELGCGSHKREGFYGIDLAPGPAVDLVLDIETQPLSFADDSVDHVYSSHAFEHLEHPSSPQHPLREIVRVCRDGARVEIWTPHGRSNDGLLFGHRNFYTETHWEHVCILYPDFYLADTRGRFGWEATEHVVSHGCLEQLRELNIPFGFAQRHFANISLEFGVFLRVMKQNAGQAASVRPVVRAGYRRGEYLDLSPAPKPAPAPPTPPEEPLRHRVADALNDTAKAAFPAAHRLATGALRKFVTRP